LSILRDFCRTAACAPRARDPTSIMSSLSLRINIVKLGSVKTLKVRTLTMRARTLQDSRR